MRTTIALLCCAALALVSLPAPAALKVLACEPEWGALVRELGAERVEVRVATSAMQDVHRVEARPSLIAAARSADLLVCTGADLESAWLPVLLAQSGNRNIQPGNPGYFEAAQHVPMLEIPASLDRSQGDVHAAGNPHLHLDARNIARVAAALGERLAQLDPSSAEAHRGRAGAFSRRWADAVARWERAAAPLRGVPVVVHHRDHSYLLSWLGMREAGSLEPRPGLPPGTVHLAELVERMRREPARAIVRAAYASPKAAEFLAERTRLPVVILPYTVGGSERADDLFGLFEDTLARLLAVLR